MTYMYILRKKELDMYGELPEIWEDVSWTTNVEIAKDWRNKSGMYTNRDFINLTEAKSE